MLIDTHCHIHEPDYPLDVDEVIKRAHENGVNTLICVGTSEQDSRDALKFASSHTGVYASVGIHPHYATDSLYNCGDLEDLIKSNRDSIVAIGEIGLDYFRSHSLHEDQINLLRSQIKLALKYDLPIIFHVRDAFDDFWPVLDEFQDIRGVMHSFTDTDVNLQKAIIRGLYIGVNGYSTFTKDESQKAMFAAIPIEKMLLETDAPFLTPVPFRGKVNEPAFVRNIAEYQGMIHKISFEKIATVTTTNACALFKL